MTHGHHVHWPPLALALVLAMLSFWLNRLTDRPALMDNGGFSHDPDYIVEQFDALTFDAAGRPKYRLSAERMTHYMDDDTTVLDNPLFQSLDKTAPVRVNARRAQLSGDGQWVHFLKRVQIVRANPGRPAAMTLDTEYLRVAPERRVMFTDQPVTLRQGATVVTADGLAADDVKGQLKLTGNVRGRYDKTR